MVSSAGALKLVEEPAPTGSFKHVAGKLDEGGSFYLIWNFGGAIRSTLDSAEKLVKVSGEPRAALGFPVVRSVIRSLGFDQLGFLGVSHGSDSKNRSRQTVFIEAAERRGLLALGGEPRELSLLSYLPENTATALVVSLEFSRIIPLIEETATAATGILGAKQVQDGLEKVRKKEGVDIRGLLNTAGNEVGGAIWLNPTETITVPTSKDKTIVFPRPHLAIMLNTTSDSLFRLAVTENEKKNTPIQLETWEGWSVLAAPASKDIPEIAPVLAWREGLTAIADSTSTLRILSETRRSGADVRTSPEWKSMAEGMSPRLLKALFFSPRTVGSVVDIVDKVPADNSRDRNGKKVVQEILKMFGTGCLTTATYEDGGFLSVTVTEKP